MGTIALTIALDALAEYAGRDLGRSSRQVLDQDRVDAFAALTGDDQWLHVDPGRAAHGPFGGTVVHGFLLLALIPVVVDEVVEVTGVAHTINSRLDGVRFRRPVRTGGGVVGAVALESVRARPRGTMEAVLRIDLEGDDGAVACRAQQTFLYTA